MFSYQPKNILAHFFAKMENQNLLSLALNHPRLNCERRNHENKDMVFCVKVSWFSNKVHASHNNLTDFFKEKKLGGQKRPLSVYDLYMYIYFETMTDAFVLPFAATTPTTLPVKGKCLGPVYFKIPSSKRAFWGWQ